jgi:hypothetical protein
LTIAGTCDWTAAAGPSDTWLTVTPGGGRGNSTITVSAPANAGAARTATVMIAQQAVTVTQPGSCAVNSNPASDTSYGPAGGRGTIRVETAQGCNWSASSNQEWARLTQSSGSGNGEAAYNVSFNGSTSSRTAIITIGNRQHTITQRGCSFTLTPATHTIPAEGGGGTFQLQTDGACQWAISGAIEGMTLTPSSGTGNEKVSYTVPSNPATSARTITLRVGGQTHVITQQGAAPTPTCTFQLDSPSRSFPAGGGGPVTVRVTATPQPCAGTWSVTNSAPDWVQVSGGSGSGSGEFSYTVLPNNGTAERTATLTVGGQTHQITQAGQPPTPTSCTFQLDSGSKSFPADGGNATVTVTAAPAGCTGTWNVVGAPDWVQVSNGSGSASGAFSYTLTRNGGAEQRTAALSVGGQPHQIIQAGQPPTPTACAVSVNPAASPQFGASAASGGFNIETPSTCQWTISGGDGWATVTNGSTGTGAKPVAYNVANNPTTANRTTTLVVSTQAGSAAHTVNQAGATPPPPPPPQSCTFQLNPTSRSFTAAGGDGRFDVITQKDCQWSASENVNWVSVGSGGSGSDSGTGPREVSYRVDQNPATSARSTTIVVNGQPHTVNQEAMAAPPLLCAYALDPEKREFDAPGGEGSTHVSTSETCSWSASVTVDWITLTARDGRGPGDARYLVAVNDADDDREAAVRINGQTHRVKQRKHR